MNGVKIEEALLKFKEQVAALQDVKDFFNYEKEFVQLWQQTGKEVLEASLSKNLDVKKSKKKDENAVG